ncbi:MAG: AtpZ/AtpI family protein [Desulfobacterales bacterium]|nr:AtpZ/AtpI family protein [Desulfobacterales bacterium]
MKEDKHRSLRQLVYFSSLGFSVSFSIFIGLAIGIYLDQKVFDTTPWLTLAGLGFGIAAAYRNIALAIRKSRDL